MKITKEIFQSTPSARRATAESGNAKTGQQISIHALREEGDNRHEPANINGTISIHALREEGDRELATSIIKNTKFQSTPSARRATLALSAGTANSLYFNPRPPRGGRLPPQPPRLPKRFISIHALREEGDWDSQAAVH